MLEYLTTENLIALVTLASLEIVLGIDNVVFLSILSGKLSDERPAKLAAGERAGTWALLLAAPVLGYAYTHFRGPLWLRGGPQNELLWALIAAGTWFYWRPRLRKGSRRELARSLGLYLAMFARIALLLSLSWVMGLTQPWFNLFGHAVSGRDVILLGGGLFLIAKATFEIHDKLEGAEHGTKGSKLASFGLILVQIIALDLVFSLDSVITAVGMAQQIWVMIMAVVMAVMVMLVFAGAIGSFIERHPTMKMLALSFLLLIGVMLVAEGFGKHIEKGYIYFAMAFSLLVEVLNMRLRRKVEPVHLRHTTVE